MWFGATLIVVGVIFLLDNLGFLSSEAWKIIWPLVIIIIGIAMLFKRPTSSKTDQKQEREKK